ncbi:MAG: RHS repeat domain-containing protein, partial [Draconibacterium sp.]
INYNYNANGYMYEIKDKLNRSIWKALTADARGQLTKTQKGNKSTDFTYNAAGLPSTIKCPGIIDKKYEFTTGGNLTSHEDFLASQKETYTYSSTNQLTGWETESNGIVSDVMEIQYDGHGNITGKSDLFYQMNYDHPQKLHAITSISGDPSPIADDTQNITYTDFGKVKTVSEGNKSLGISYGVDRQRTKSVFTENGSTTLTRYYLGGYEEDHTAAGIKKVHYISGSKGLAGIYVEAGGSGTLYYAYTDYLGSLTALTSENGTVSERYAFDAWGNRRNPNAWTIRLIGENNSVTDRGFTMHEHLDGFALINMNGRMYDPQIARFLSPDPILQAPGYWLNFTRYAYVFNNPIKYVDPSGNVAYNTGQRKISRLEHAYYNGKMGVIAKYGFAGWNKFVEMNPTWSHFNPTILAPLDEKSLLLAIQNFESGYEGEEFEWVLQHAFVDGQYKDSRYIRKRRTTTVNGGYVNRLLAGGSNVGSIWGMYDNFGYNHTSYPTTKGTMKNFSAFTGRKMSRQALTYLNRSKLVSAGGNWGTSLMVFSSAFNYYNGDRTMLNYVDGGIGLTGVGNSFFLKYSSYGSASLSSFVALYGAGRLLYDFVGVPNINQIQNNIENNKFPLDGVYNPTTGMYDRSYW